MRHISNATWETVDIGNKSRLKPELVKANQKNINIYLFEKKEIHCDFPINRIYMPYDIVLDGFRRNDCRVVPVIPNITKGWHDENIMKKFKEIVKIAGENGILIGNLGWIDPFVSSGVNVYGDYGLNIYNSMDFLEAKNLGLKEAVFSHEVI